MPFKPGNNANPTGRPVGSINETSRMVRETFAALLQGREPQLQAALDQLRERDPRGFLEYYVKISERFVGPVSRQEITGADGEAFSPINIVLPKRDE